ncbi:MAG: aldo/keto reductase [Deltaproteobacteria bacterium]|nr:aldo/keto reductase [Deltaproteobacteria bacterium]
MTRREFWQGLTAMTAALAVPSMGGAADGERDKFGPLLPKRKLGNGGPAVTMLGVGGAHISDASEKDAQAIIETAMAEGVRFFDTAAMYGGGQSERRYGAMLVPKYRDHIFLMTKSTAGDGKSAARELDESLSRLRCEYVDLWQMHSLMSAGDAESRVKNGVLDVFLDAQKRGKVRHIGFTGHTDFRSHVRMTELLRERGVKVVSAQMPINVVDPHHESFVENAVPPCVAAGIGVIAMKTMAFGRLLGQRRGWRRNNVAFEGAIPGAVAFEDAMRFVWSLPISVLVSGMESPTQVRQNAKLARTFNPLTDAERQALLTKTKNFAGPNVEFYKG